MHNSILREILAGTDNEANIVGQLEILGTEEILGLSDFALGAAKQAAGKLALTGQTADLAQAIRAGTRGYQVVEKPTTGIKQQVIGFIGTANLAAAGTENVSRQPQTVFKPTRLVVDSTVANLFDITDVRVGTRSQLPTANNIPGMAFSERADAMEIDFETCPAAISIIVAISNVSNAAATFRGALRGVALV